MPPFLASLGIKDAIYAAIIAAILGALYLVYHRGEVHVEQKDALAVAKQETHVAVVETTAKDQIKDEASHDTQIESSPIAPVAPIRLCRQATPAVPAASSANSGAPAPVVGAGDTAVAQALPDTADLVRIGRDDDAYIASLEAEIKTLREEMTK